MVGTLALVILPACKLVSGQEDQIGIEGEDPRCDCVLEPGNGVFETKRCRWLHAMSM